MKPKIALFVPSLRGGGAERVMVNLALGLSEKGYNVDLVLSKAEGIYLSNVPTTVRVVDLRSRRVLQSLPALARYLSTEKPYSLLSAPDHANIVALLAKLLTFSRTRVIISLHNTISHDASQAKTRRARSLPWLARHLFPMAHRIVAVSQGVADDFRGLIGPRRPDIDVIYNPVVTSRMLLESKRDVEHPWFVTGGPPVVLGVGRLVPQKNFRQLIEAFALVRSKRQARLVILGEGEQRLELECLARNLGIWEDVWMPGFKQDVHAYMARAAVFVLSSKWEGLPTVLIESLAVGTSAVATDCPSGPREIFAISGTGHLAPVDDTKALAKSIEAALCIECSGYANVDPFKLETIVSEYERVLT